MGHDWVTCPHVATPFQPIPTELTVWLSAVLVSCPVTAGQLPLEDDPPVSTALMVSWSLLPSSCSTSLSCSVSLPPGVACMKVSVSAGWNQAALAMVFFILLAMASHSLGRCKDLCPCPPGPAASRNPVTAE